MDIEKLDRTLKDVETELMRKKLAKLASRERELAPEEPDSDEDDEQDEPDAPEDSEDSGDND